MSQQCKEASAAHRLVSCDMPAMPVGTVPLNMLSDRTLPSGNGNPLDQNADNSGADRRTIQALQPRHLEQNRRELSGEQVPAQVAAGTLAFLGTCFARGWVRAHMAVRLVSCERVSGSVPFKRCPLRSLHEGPIPLTDRRRSAVGGRKWAYMFATMSEHRKSPIVAGTVPPSVA